MSELARGITAARVFLWIARVAGTAAIVPLVLIAFGERGSEPSGPREWVYLALFPFAFSATSSDGGGRSSVIAGLKARMVAGVGEVCRS